MKRDAGTEVKTDLARSSDNERAVSTHPVRRLEGEQVVLEPLVADHAERLARAAADPAIWLWMPLDGSTAEGFEAWLEAALAGARTGTEIPFVTVWRETGDLLGSTRYLSLAPEHCRLEIGHTWLTRSAWGTGANIEAKLLLLRYAFERLGCIRVEFKTDASNERSRAALSALPARFEGVHRQHMLVRDGERRDSAWYSILDDEWPEVEANLLRRLGR
jgi:RimJ/RimL family protein N-acetyltransferase